MKYLIVSDTHLGRRVNRKKLAFLKQLFQKYEEIIFIGDFWDHYSISFDDFINSPWSELFPLMQHKTVYIYGNHDKEKWCDERVSLFSKEQANIYEKEIGPRKFIFRHGHRIDGFKQSDADWFVRLDRALALNNIGLVIDYIITIARRDGCEKLRAYAKSLPEGEILFAGHKHKQVVELENNLIVNGWVLFGRADYFVLDDAGGIEAFSERY